MSGVAEKEAQYQGFCRTESSEQALKTIAEAAVMVESDILERRRWGPLADRQLPGDPKSADHTRGAGRILVLDRIFRSKLSNGPRLAIVLRRSIESYPTEVALRNQAAASPSARKGGRLGGPPGILRRAFSCRAQGIAAALPALVSSPSAT